MQQILLTNLEANMKKKFEIKTYCKIMKVNSVKVDLNTLLRLIAASQIMHNNYIYSCFYLLNAQNKKKKNLNIAENTKLS